MIAFPESPTTKTPNVTNAETETNFYESRADRFSHPSSVREWQGNSYPVQVAPDRECRWKVGREIAYCCSPLVQAGALGPKAPSHLPAKRSDSTSRNS
jgi:hypothetical protein